MHDAIYSAIYIILKSLKNNLVLVGIQIGIMMILSAWFIIQYNCIVICNTIQFISEKELGTCLSNFTEILSK